jgi:hypothetical protein
MTVRAKRESVLHRVLATIGQPRPMMDFKIWRAVRSAHERRCVGAGLAFAVRPQQHFGYDIGVPLEDGRRYFDSFR